MHAQPYNPDRQPPLVRAVLAADGVNWRITCPHCQTIHVHGTGEGHRQAHCLKGTPHRELGYVLLGPADTDDDQEAA